MKTISISILVLVLVVVGLWYFLPLSSTPVSELESGENIETPSFTYTNADEDLITIASPQPGSGVEHMFTLSGEARGNWYFEASFPIEVRDENGALLLQTHAEAAGEWMTTDFVPFSVTLSLDESYTGPAMVILRNDNASGLPEYDRSVAFPIIVE